MGRLPTPWFALALALGLARALAMTSMVACAPAVVPANGTGPLDAIEDECPIEPDSLVLVDAGEVPVVITSAHAGETAPLGCSAGDSVLRGIEARACTPAHDACVSGPCRAGSGDGGARLLTFALVEELAKCLGGRPHLALTEMSRTLVDMNRDAHDPAGALCALDDDAALPYWEAYHRGIEGAVAAAVAQAEQRGGHALLVDLHTYSSLPAAPPPAVMLGTGVPFGTTLPLLAADDPSLATVFGEQGLRARLLETLAPIAAQVTAVKPGTLAVLPTSRDASLEGLFAGRYIVHRYARVVPGETQGSGPAIDALQVEVSAGLRDEGIATAEAIARALCDSFGARLGAPGRPSRGRRGGRRDRARRAILGSGGPPCPPVKRRDFGERRALEHWQECRHSTGGHGGPPLPVEEWSRP